MLLDANILLYAVDATSRWHPQAAEWLQATLNGDRRVALPWQTLGAFLRIATHPRAVRHPLPPEEAAEYVESWLALDLTWVPPTTDRTARILLQLMQHHRVGGNLVPDVQLAALAIEHGLTVYTTDSDFARFPEVRWTNPLL